MSEPSEPEPVVLDVRPVLAEGGDPFEAIVSAADRLAAGEELVIVNSFEPFPLYEILGARGLEHTVERLPDGDWRVTFRRAGGEPEAAAKP